MTQEELITFCNENVRWTFDHLRSLEKDHPDFELYNKQLKVYEAALVCLTAKPDVYVVELLYSTETMRARRYKVEVMDKDLERGYTLYSKPHYKVEE